MIYLFASVAYLVLYTLLYLAFFLNYGYMYQYWELTMTYFVVMSTKSRTTRKKRVLEGLQDEGTDALGQRDKRVRSENQGLYASASWFNDNDYTISDYK